MSTTTDTRPDIHRICVLILGMHRSGTSALSGVLHHLGCDLAAHRLDANSSNGAGFFDSSVIRQFNEEILASAGSSWDEFQAFSPEWRASAHGQDFLDRAVDLLGREFGQSRLFVIKDPRICRFAPFWIDALGRIGCEIRPILMIRSPLDVGHSMRQRHQFSEALSQMIWLRHGLDAEAATRGFAPKRLTTNFDQLMQGWEIVAERARRQLDIIWPRSIEAVEFDVAHFLSTDHRHHPAGDAQVLGNPLLTEWVREFYHVLSRWAEAGEDPDDYPVLDRIKAEFDIASRAFSRLSRAERDQTVTIRAKVESLTKERDSLTAAAEDKTRAAEDGRRAVTEKLLKERAEFETLRVDFAEQVQAKTHDNQLAAHRIVALEAQVKETLKRESALARQLQEQEARSERQFAVLEARLQDNDKLLAQQKLEASSEREGLQRLLIENAARSERDRMTLERALDQATRKADAQRIEIAKLTSQAKKPAVIQPDVKPDILQKKADELADLKRRLAKAEQLKRQRDVEADALAKKLELRTDEIRTLKSLAKKVHRERDEAVHQLFLIKNGLTWKMIAPTRRFVLGCRKILRGR
ncbi:hypothetical protein LQ948_04845 [Jiella sp. MQZ9-1]|uniref:Sulfotransferase family protein n=1 Tax=Jiella flava TaxID=2816857 RepID=A0A939FUE7_9HYPH|nr:hypothetical protein [Jiella flava]MBO0662138.1 hypothetical protein [Jiella flava]MCD2470533.1 hypothetical protein [Jiella flava]